LKFQDIKKFESLLYSLNTFSGVTSDRCPSLRQGPHIKVAVVASRWQCMGDMIGLGFEPHTSRLL